MLNVRVVTQPLVVSACVTVIAGALHVSVAVTNPFTLASVGKLPAAGLQPKLLPLGDAVITGNVTSTVQVTVRATATAALPQASVARNVTVTVRLQLSAGAV